MKHILSNHENYQDFKIIPGQSNLKILKVNQGALYLSFQISQNNKLKGYGQLSTHFSDIYEEIPQNKLIFPNNGEIEGN